MGGQYWSEPWSRCQYEELDWFDRLGIFWEPLWTSLKDFILGVFGSLICLRNATLKVRSATHNRQITIKTIINLIKNYYNQNSYGIFYQHIFYVFFSSLWLRGRVRDYQSAVLCSLPYRKMSNFSLWLELGGIMGKNLNR